MRDRICPTTDTGERQLAGHHVQVLLIEKLKGSGIIRAAAKHNHRELASELGADSHIDPTRSVLNSVLRGASTAAGVAEHAKSLMHAAGVKKPRKDAVLGMEFIFSLPQGSGTDQDAFFEAATQWVEDSFGGKVISAVTHLDEDAPHAHVIVLPLVEGHMVGSSLVGPYGPVHDDFHQQVGKRFGLTRQAKSKRLSAAMRRQAMDAAFAVLQANSGLSDEVLRVLLVPHLADPTSLMAVLNLAMPEPSVIKGSFVAIMTKPCKPKQSTGPRTKPIGFDVFITHEKDQSVCSVGFDEPNSAPAPAPEPASAPYDKAVIAAAERPVDAGNVTATMVSMHVEAAMVADRVAVEPERYTGEDPGILCALDTSAAGDTDSSAANDAVADWVRVHDHDQPCECWDWDTGKLVTPQSKPASAKSRAEAVVAAVLKSDERGSLPDLNVELWWAG